MKTCCPYTVPRVLVTLLFLSCSVYLGAQNTGVYKKLYASIYLSNSGSKDFLKNEHVHKATLKSLKNFYKDKSSRSRSKAYGIARNVYNYSDDPKVKQKVVKDHLLACTNDRSISLRYRLANHLIQFEKEDFDAESLLLIKDLIENDPNKKHYIVIAGYKEIDIELPDISTYTEEEVVESWDIIQGMARVGNPEAVQICRKIVKEHPLDIKFFDRLLPGLVFTNDRQILDDIITEILDDDVELIGQRLKDYQRYFMLKHILPLMYEYPYQFVDEGQLTYDEFYHQLSFAMDWLRANKETYTLIHVESPLKQKKSPYLSGDLSSF